MGNSPAICWFRLALRLDDHPALRTAAERGGPVIPLFVWAPEEEAPWQPGAASRVWLHHSLANLDAQLGGCDSRLILRRGPSAVALLSIAKETGATAVFYNRRNEPALKKQDKETESVLRRAGLEVCSFDTALLFDHDTVRTASGAPFQSFTPFWNACLRQGGPSKLAPVPTSLPIPAAWPDSLGLSDLALDPKTAWSTGLIGHWKAGITAGSRALQEFRRQWLPDYDLRRDRPDLDGTSRLSPHLHFGEVSPRRVWYDVKRAARGQPGQPPSSSAESFMRQLGWREFAHYLLHHFPQIVDQPMRSEFLGFPSEADPKMLRAWQRGSTGYPFIDAGMRQLWATGWIHNRARMAVGSFLTKDLLIPWQEGARWFWDTLVDADLANNTLGWQWVAGCAADAAPFFRIFNPVLQGQNFDPDGNYVRRWVPELARLPSTWVHNPWDAPPEVLGAAGVSLGQTYPRPIVDHAVARRRALAAFDSIRGKGSEHLGPRSD